MSNKNKPLILGHRGARRQAPENTIPAFIRALNLGADGVELDVQLSADGVVVVFHDDQLDHLTDGHGPVSSLTWAQLQQLDAGKYFGADFAGTRLCTLEEALRVLEPAKLINVELKGTAGAEQANGPAALAQRTLELVRAAEMLNRVVFSSFDAGYLAELRRLDGQAALAWLFGAKLFRRPPWRLAKELGLEAIHPSRLAVSARLVRQAHERGLKVRVWTVDDPAEARRLAGWGVEGLITDYPGEAFSWLQEF